jgi:hypothetical protein
MQIVANNFPRGLKPYLLQALMYELKPVPFNDSNAIALLPRSPPDKTAPMRVF